ncbi:response regulator [Phenylobacterium sp.]|uniref:response regulator n=1 Tax=Phenylobacterium sp. TaxID=1871053 RepID=UPI002811D30D|nr:response regulator [Phenylobacterium sp.]
MSLPEFFFERVSADLRQQLEGVQALADRLTERRLAPDAQACAEGIAEAAEGLRRLLANALQLRAAAAEAPTLAIAPVRLRELADALQDTWTAKAAGAGVTLLVSYDGDPEASALADRERLLQVFDGLIGEAVGARSRGAVEVTLRAAAGPAGVQLEGLVRAVRDAEWEGLDLERRIRAIDARLGLEAAMAAMLARHVLGAMGGQLRRETGAGASETLAFDVQLAHAPVAEAPHQAAPRAAHVLVVDDNATNRMVAQSLVEMFDCTSEAAEDGLEAIDAVRTGRFDLVLMDIRMPRMDGVAATRAIRALAGPIARIPIIALTANADPDDAAGYIAAGMNAVVEKPMKPEQLLEALNATLAAAESAAETAA